MNERMTSRHRLTQLTSEIFCIIAVIFNLVVVSRSQGSCYIILTAKNVFVRIKPIMQLLVKRNHIFLAADIYIYKALFTMSMVANTEQEKKNKKTAYTNV